VGGIIYLVATCYMQNLKWAHTSTILLLFTCASRWVQSNILTGDKFYFYIIFGLVVFGVVTAAGKLGKGLGN